MLEFAALLLTCSLLLREGDDVAANLGTIAGWLFLFLRKLMPLLPDLEGAFTIIDKTVSCRMQIW